MKTIIFLIMTLALAACDNKTNTKIDEQLFHTAENSLDKLEQYKACILLAELPVNDQLIEKIKNNSIQDFSCSNYLLAKYRIDLNSTDKFITEFPEKDALKPLWSIHSQSGYVMGILPPSIKLLSELATQNENALDKLVSAIKFSDGAFSESLTDTISNIYIKMPVRVNASFKRVNLSVEETTLIIKTAEYKRNL